MISRSFFEIFYPDHSKDGTLAFYAWLRQYINADVIMLNLGAGPAVDNPLRSLRGEVQKVYGADIDPIILKNHQLDQAHVIQENGILPFEDNFFNIVLSDFVLEHVKNPKLFLDEVYRVLKPGGMFFFRTPNKYHYVSLIARFTPHWFHVLVANRVRYSHYDAHEPYLTYHRLNSKKDITQLANQLDFATIELRFFEANPSYFMFHEIPFLMGVGYERLVNHFALLEQLRVNIFGKLTK
jgi:ubiquinone/menaquinone biosynthesis C-methylase UbiE